MCTTIKPVVKFVVARRLNSALLHPTSWMVAMVSGSWCMVQIGFNFEPISWIKLVGYKKLGRVYGALVTTCDSSMYKLSI